MEGFLGAKVLFFMAIVGVQVANSLPPSAQVKPLYHWNPFTFADLPHSETSQVDGYNYYIGKYVLPTAVSLHSKTGCMFFPVLRLNPGVPATVTYVNTNDYYKGSSPVLRGFPTYEDNYVPGWFGVDTLASDDYLHNVYPGYGKKLKSVEGEEEKNREEVKKEEEKKEEDVEKEKDEDKKEDDQAKVEEEKAKETVEEKPVNKEEKHEDEIVNEDVKDFEKKDNVEEEDDETRKKHGSHNKDKPNYHNKDKDKDKTKPSHHNKGPTVVYVPVPVPAAPPAHPTTEPPTPATKPPYKPPYHPPYEPEYEYEHKPTYKPKPTYTTTTEAPSRDLYHFVSVYYTSMDNQCDRLFFVDYGVQRIFGKVVYTRKPVLWAFPVNECSAEGLDQPPVLKVTIPDSVVNDPTGFSTFTVDIYGSCNEFAVYIANCYDNTVVVYDNVKKYFWYFQHETFQPGAERSLVSDYLPPMDSYNYGVMGIALGATTKYSYKEFFYAPGSSYGVFKTNTEVLRNKYLSPGDPTSSDFSFVGYGGLDRQSIFSYDDVTQVLFSVHLLSNTLQCWNTNTPLENGNVATLFSDLEFGVDLLFDAQRNIRFLLYSGDGLTFYDQGRTRNPFYQLYVVSIDAVIKGTPCDPRNV